MILSFLCHIEDIGVIAWERNFHTLNWPAVIIRRAFTYSPVDNNYLWRLANGKLSSGDRPHFKLRLTLAYFCSIISGAFSDGWTFLLVNQHLKNSASIQIYLNSYLYVCLFGINVNSEMKF